MPDILAYLGNISVVLYVEEISAELSLKEMSYSSCCKFSRLHEFAFGL